MTTLGIEAVGQARSADPDNANSDLRASTAMMIDAVEATLTSLLGETCEQAHEGAGQLDPQIVQNAMRKSAMLYADRKGP